MESFSLSCVSYQSLTAHTGSLISFYKLVASTDLFRCLSGVSQVKDAEILG